MSVLHNLIFTCSQLNNNPCPSPLIYFQSVSNSLYVSHAPSVSEPGHHVSMLFYSTSFSKDIWLTHTVHAQQKCAGIILDLLLNFQVTSETFKGMWTNVYFGLRRNKLSHSIFLSVFWNLKSLSLKVLPFKPLGPSKCLLDLDIKSVDGICIKRVSPELCFQLSMESALPCSEKPSKSFTTAYVTFSSQ